MKQNTSTIEVYKYLMIIPITMSTFDELKAVNFNLMSYLFDPIT